MEKNELSWFSDQLNAFMKFDLKEIDYLYTFISFSPRKNPAK